MSTGYLPIVRTYQFVSETIFFYFLLVPFYYFIKDDLPFWSYIVTIITTLVVLQVLLRFTNSFLPFFIYTPLCIVALVWGLGYPLYVGIAIASFFTWRFIVHQQEEGMDHEYGILLATLFIFILESLIIKDGHFYAMVVLQFTVLIFGYLLSHVASVKVSSSKQKPYKLIAYLFTAFITITFAFFFLYDSVVAIIGKIGSIILMQVAKIVGLIKIDGDSVEFPVQEELEYNMGDEERDVKELAPQAKEVIGAESFMFWLSLIIIGIIAFLIFRKYYKQKINKVNSENEDTSIEMTKWKEEGSNNVREKISKFFRKKPDNYIRQLFYDFERFAHKQGYGREHYETIEDWFERLGMSNENVDLYQKVRYGEASLSEQDAMKFKSELKDLKRFLLEKK